MLAWQERHRGRTLAGSPGLGPALSESDAELPTPRIKAPVRSPPPVPRLSGGPFGVSPTATGPTAVIQMSLEDLDAFGPASGSNPEAPPTPLVQPRASSNTREPKKKVRREMVTELDAECKSCGNIFMPDSNFCRRCGAPRGSTRKPVQRKRAGEPSRTWR